MLWLEADIKEAKDTFTVRPTGVQPAREPGLHLSHIVRDMVDQIQPRKNSPLIQDARNLYMEVGEAFEDAIERTLNDRSWDYQEPGFRPDAVKFEGIWASADRLAMGPDGPVVEEHKATWKSCREGISSRKFFAWWMQVAAYMWIYETRAGRIRVLWVCGNYKPPIPQRMRYDFTLPPETLRRNWESIHAHAVRKGWLARKGDEWVSTIQDT